jgi:hypothetical protein
VARCFKDVSRRESVRGYILRIYFLSEGQNREGFSYVANRGREGSRNGIQESTGFNKNIKKSGLLTIRDKRLVLVLLVLVLVLA